VKIESSSAQSQRTQKEAKIRMICHRKKECMNVVSEIDGNDPSEAAVKENAMFVKDEQLY
jgi:hypothetical protein